VLSTSLLLVGVVEAQVVVVLEVLGPVRVFL
jgi:hypothetical protein